MPTIRRLTLVTAWNRAAQSWNTTLRTLLAGARLRDQAPSTPEPYSHPDDCMVTPPSTVGSPVSVPPCSGHKRRAPPGCEERSASPNLKKGRAESITGGMRRTPQPILTKSKLTLMLQVQNPDGARPPNLPQEDNAMDTLPAPQSMATCDPAPAPAPPTGGSQPTRIPQGGVFMDTSNGLQPIAAGTTGLLPQGLVVGGTTLTTEVFLRTLQSVRRSSFRHFRLFPGMLSNHQCIYAAATLPTAKPFKREVRFTRKRPRKPR